MGIVNLYNLIEAYLRENFDKQHAIKSDICYIDCTSKIYSYLNNYYRNEKKQESMLQKNNIFLIIDDILNNIAFNFIKQITENKYYKKFILVFDFKQRTEIKRIKFDEDLMEYYEKNPELTQFDKKEQISAIPLIPRSVDILNTDINDLYLMIYNAYKIRWSYWHFKAKNIDNYINVNYLIQKISDDYYEKYNSDIKLDLDLNLKFDIEDRNNSLIIYNKLQNLKRYNFQTYLIHRGLKRFALKHKRYPHYNDLKKSYLSEETDDVFSDKFKKQIFQIYPQLIVDLIPNLIFKIQEGVKNSSKEIEFLGCEEEADYVIYQHIKKYNYANQCPTINTNDSDMVLLLHDVDCIIKIKKRKHDKAKQNFNINKLQNKKNENLNPNHATFQKNNPKHDLINNANSYQKTSHCDNLILRPKEFWKWLIDRDEKMEFKNLLMLAVCLGTSYNNIRTKFRIDTIKEIRTTYSNTLYDDILNEIRNTLKNKENKKNIGLLQMFNAIEYYRQIDLLEESFHYIKPSSELSKTKIEQRYYDIFTQLLLK